VSRSRRLAKAIKPRPNYRIKTPVRPPTAAERITPLSPADVLERINRARLQREELDAELALLIDHAVALGITWPQIASRLRVTRQAARQQYQRRHRRPASGCKKRTLSGVSGNDVPVKHQVEHKDVQRAQRDDYQATA
jgi:hypothetical protein